MNHPTWSANGGRGRRRWKTVVALAGIAVLAVGSLAFAWFDPTTSPDERTATPVPQPAAPNEDSVDTEEPAPVWHCPVQGRTTFRDDYGYRKPSGRIHRGVDLYAPRGTPVAAPQPGRIEQLTGGIAGNQVVVHGDGRRYVFTHLDRFAGGSTAEAGQVVGYVGTSGNARGSRPHLHFEIRGPQGPMDPFPLLDEHCR